MKIHPEKDIPFFEVHNIDSPIGAYLKRKINKWIFIPPVRQCAKGLYAGKRSFHSRGIEAKMGLFEEKPK